MPFKPFKEKKEWCIYEVDDDGKKIKKIGCGHKSKKDAIAQIGAIESKEKEKGKSAGATVNYFVRVGTSVDMPDAITTSASWPADTTIGTAIGDNNTLLITEPESMKAHSDESLDERISAIHSAFNDVYDFNLWIVEIFSEFIVVWDRLEKTHYKVVYTEDGESFDFAKRNEWEEVKLKKEWVAKFINGEHLTEDDFAVGDEQQLPDARGAIKTLGANRVGGYAMLWGDENNLDLHGEFFTPDTKDTTAIFDEMGLLPLIVHHASDDGVQKFVGGAVDVLEPDDIGLWFEAKTKEFEAYSQYVKPLIDDQMAFTSTGTLPAARRAKKSGEITRWPVSEVSATWTPAEWRMLNHPISEVKSYFDELGVDVDLSQYDDDDGANSKKQEQVNQGAEKARLKELVNMEFAKLELLEFEIQET